MSSLLYDGEGRRVRYLRMSVTDRCELRCLYCLPKEGLPLMKTRLTLEETARLVRLCVDLGIRKVRVTGGEPLSRAGVPELVAQLSSDPRIEDLSLTTNGTRLADLAESLRAAGLHRVNVSLDSLDPAVFARIRGGAKLDSVLEGIDRALEVGLPVKVNVVILKNVTEQEAVRLADFAAEKSIEIRFIEYMPLNGSAWSPQDFEPAETIRHRIEASHELGPEEDSDQADRVARVFRIAGTNGRVGFISTFSEPFCSTCSRIRLSSYGGVRLCLFSPLEVSLLPLLRGGADDHGGSVRGATWRGQDGLSDPRGACDQTIRDFIRRLVQRKPKGHGLTLADARRPDAAGGALIRTVGG